MAGGGPKPKVKKEQDEAGPPNKRSKAASKALAADAFDPAALFGDMTESTMTPRSTVSADSVSMGTPVRLRRSGAMVPSFASMEPGAMSVDLEGDGERQGGVNSARIALRAEEKKKTKKALWSMCPICLKSPDQLQASGNPFGWYEYDDRRRPVGAGCKLHMVACIVSYPHKNVHEVALIYHSKDDEAVVFRKEFDLCSKLLARILEREDLPQFLPVAATEARRQYIVSSYYEVGFLQEGELQKWIGATSKQLGLGKPSTLQLEDGSGNVQGFHVSLQGLPLPLMLACRKIKVESNLSLSKTELLSSPFLQLRQGQADEILQHNLSKNVEARQTAERCSGRGHLHSFESLVLKAESLQQAQKSQEQNLNALSDDEQSDGESLESDASEENSGLPPGVTPGAAVSCSSGLAVSGGMSAPKAKAKAGNKRKNSGAASGALGGPGDVDVVEIGSGGSGAEISETDLLKEIGDDLVLKQILRALETPHPCLAGLIPSKVLFHKIRVGHQLRGARTLFDRLKKLRSPAAAALSRRSDVMERCQILAFKRIKSIPRAELAQHISVMEANKVPLPFAMRLDLREDELHDYFGTPAGEDPQVEPQDLAKPFEFWTDGELKDSSLNLSAVLVAQEEFLRNQTQAGELGPGELPEELKKMQEAVAEAFAESFGCQALLNALVEPQKSKARLIGFCQAFAMIVNCFWAWREKGNAIGKLPNLDCFLPKVRTVEMVAKAALCLLSVSAHEYGADISFVTQLQKSKSQDAFVASVHDTLFAEGSFWSKLYDDLVTRGTATVSMQPRLKHLLSAFSAEELKPSDVELVASELPILKKSMRVGSTMDAEKLIYKKLTATGTAILSGGLRPTLQLLDPLTTALMMFKDTPGVLHLVQKLGAYRKKELSMLAAEELDALLKLYPERTDDLDAPQIRKTLPKLSSMLEQLPTIGQATFQLLKEVFFWHFRDLYSQVEVSDQDLDVESVLVRLKDILKKMEGMEQGCPQETNELLYEAYTPDFMTWVTCALDSFAYLKSFEECAKPVEATAEETEGVLRKGRLLQSSLEKMRALEDDTLELGMGTMTVCFSWSEKARVYLEGCAAFNDLLGRKVASLSSLITEHQGSLFRCARGFHETWKDDLGAEADLEDILVKAKETLATLQGDMLDQGIEAFEKVLKTVKRFFQLASPFMKSMEASDLEHHQLPLGWKGLQAVRALKAEATLCMALDTMSTGKEATKAEISFSRGLLRTTLAEISEGTVPQEDVHKTLLDVARSSLQEPLQK